MSSFVWAAHPLAVFVLRERLHVRPDSSLMTAKAYHPFVCVYAFCDFVHDSSENKEKTATTEKQNKNKNDFIPWKIILFDVPTLTAKRILYAKVFKCEKGRCVWDETLQCEYWKSFVPKTKKGMTRGKEREK